MFPLSITINNTLYPVLDLPNHPRALLDRTLAKIYGVETRQINRVVSRHPKNFPEAFCFQLNRTEAKSLNHLTQGKLTWNKGHLPKAFTHVGCNMLATLLESDLAVERSIQIVQAFSDLEARSFSSLPQVPPPLIQFFNDFKNFLEASQITAQQMQAMFSQILTISQDVAKITERMNVLETQMEALMKAKGNFNENHWLFGKFTEIVAEGIDENREEIKSLKTQLKTLLQQGSQTSVKKPLK